MGRSILKNVNTHHYSTISSRSYFPHKRKLWGEKREGQKKETDFKMCSKEQQTSRLKAPLFPPFFSGCFLCSYKGTEWLWAAIGGRRGLLNRPQLFYRFPLSPPWRTSDLWGRGRIRETGGDRDKEGGVAGREGREIIMKSGNSLERERERNV